MPKISEQRRAEQRERILRAARSCFATRGIHSTTMHDICHAAKLSRGAVYGYFKSKHALIRAMFEQMEQHSRALLAKAAAAPDPAAVLFATAAGALEEMALPESRALLQLDQEFKAEAGRDKDVRERLAANFAFAVPAMTGIVTAMQAKGSLPADLEPSQVGRVLIALQDGLKPQLVADPHLDVRRFLETARALLLRPH